MPDPALEVLEDPIEKVRLWARDRSAIAALVGSRISIVLAGNAPAVRLSVVGGTSGWGEGDPLVQVECWGAANVPDDGTAGTLARTFAAAVTDGTVGLPGGSVEIGPYQSNDPSGRPRWILTVRCLTFAA